MNECCKFELTSQFRVENNYLLSFLNHIRHWQPPTAQLQRLHRTRVICEDNVTDTHIIAAATAHPNALFLTVSNAAANFINDMLIRAQQSHSIITHIITSKDVQTCPVFHSMPAVLLENRNKSIGFVNGQICSVHSMEGPTIIVQHTRGHFINTFQ